MSKRCVSTIFTVSAVSRVSVAFAAVLLLAACAGSGHHTPAPGVYDFGLPATRLAPDAPWSRLAFEIKAPYWFDTPAITYRLAYADPLKLRDYAGSRWAGTPALLLGQRLQQQLGVHGATSNMAVDCLLRIELHEFSQVFDTAQRSHGVLHGSLRLLNAKRQQLAARQIFIEQAAPTPDARGGVAALLASSDELGRQIAGWLDSLPAAAKICRSAVR